MTSAFRIAQFVGMLSALSTSCGDKRARPDDRNAPRPDPTSDAGRADPWATGSGSSITKPLPVIDDAPWKLVLDDPGNEPRRVMRYTIGAIDREAVFSMVDLDHDSRVMNTLRYRWQCAPCTYQMISMSMGDNMPAEARDDFAFIAKQVRGDVATPSDGHAEVKPGSMMTTTPSTTELFELAIVPFPTEAIGKGARWTVTNGPKVRRFTLVLNETDRATVNLAFVAETTDVKLTSDGTLDVSLSDPLARGVLDQTQQMGNLGSNVPDFLIRSRLTIE